jgi:hypothetical protein
VLGLIRDDATIYREEPHFSYYKAKQSSPSNATVHPRGCYNA